MYNPKLLQFVKETWLNENSNLQHLGIGTLQDLIIQLLQRSQHTYIVVDALDECDQPNKVAHILNVLAEYSAIFVTSRSDCEDISVILGHHPRLEITADKNQADIEQLVISSIKKDRRISRRPANIKQHISKVLLSAADGMQVVLHIILYSTHCFTGSCG
jgi:hypothetical protein